MVPSNELIRDFVNTLHKDLHGDEEDLSTPAALTDWLRSRGLLEAGTATRADLARATELREALRVLLLGNNDVDVETSGASAVLDEVARRARVGLRFAGGVPALVPAAPGVSGALGSVVAAVDRAVADGSWRRLKACRAE